MSEALPIRTVDRLMILAAAVLFSTGGAAVKLCGFSSWQVASFRSGFATVALLVLLPMARRHWSWRTILVGSAYGGTMISFVLANKLTTAANAVFLQSAAPLYILLLSPLLLGEKLRRRQIWFMVVLAGGMALIFSNAQASFVTAPNPMLGNIVGIAAGVFWSLTIIGLRWLGREDHDQSTAPAAAAVVCGNLLAFFAVLPLALPIRGGTVTDWGVVAFLGIFQIAVAYVFLVHGIRRVGALEVSLLVLVEPVLSPLWAWFIHGEKPGIQVLVGGALIIAATAWYTCSSEIEEDNQNSIS